MNLLYSYFSKVLSIGTNYFAHLEIRISSNLRHDIRYLPTQYINRLNSGIFRILELSKLNLNLKSSDRGASKIIFKDT